jgi:hypothetical protein
MVDAAADISIFQLLHEKWSQRVKLSLSNNDVRVGLPEPQEKCHLHSEATRTALLENTSFHFYEDSINPMSYFNNYFELH